MSGLIFITVLLLGGTAVICYVEQYGERFAEEHRMAAMARTGRRRDAMWPGQNRATYSSCGWRPPRPTKEERRAMRIARKSRR